MKQKQLILTLLALFASINTSAYEFDYVNVWDHWRCEVISESEKTVAIVGYWGYFSDGYTVITPQKVTDSSTGNEYLVVRIGYDLIGSSSIQRLFSGYGDS